MEIEIEGGKFHRLEGEGIPMLAEEQITQDGFEVLFVGKLQNENPSNLDHLPHLTQDARRISHVMQSANSGDGIEQVGDERQAIGISGNETISVAASEPRLRLLQLGARVVEQDDPLEVVARSVASSPGAYFEQQFPRSWQQSS